MTNMTFDHLKTIYRSFDIRGKFPEEITVDEVELIGKAIVKHFNTKKVAIGRDIRPSADALFLALSKGLCSQGCDVIDLGLCTTPMTYFIGGTTDVDATVMITASHMPSEYNGLKITVEDAKPVTADVLQILRDIVGSHTFSSESTEGNLSTHALQPDWIKNFKAKFDFKDTNLKVVIDPANMIGALEIPTFKAFAPDLTVTSIFDELDHTCPNHEANPLKYETLTDLGKEVVNQKADLGIAFDGDADRVGFVDENGNPVHSDIIGTLLACYVLARYPGAKIVYDVRSSKSLPETVKKLGGIPIKCKVGHTFIRTKMREEDAILGIELAGHFFFKESFFSEGGPLPAFMILDLMKEEDSTLSELVSEYQVYFHSGEINSTVTRTPEEIYTDLKATFPEAAIETIDGLTMNFPNWWFNVRPSQNEPVMRLNLEANSKELMGDKRDQVLKLIQT